MKGLEVVYLKYMQERDQNAGTEEDFEKIQKGNKQNSLLEDQDRDTAATSLSFQPLTYEIESMAGGMYLRMSGMRQSEFN